MCERAARPVVRVGGLWERQFRIRKRWFRPRGRIAAPTTASLSRLAADAHCLLALMLNEWFVQFWQPKPVNVTVNVPVNCVAELNAPVSV